MMNKQKVLT